MPVICRFYGILIKMFLTEHNPPHFHVVYGEYNAVFSIKDLEMTEGDLPKRAQKLVKEWATDNVNELMEMWDTKEFKLLPPLK